MARIVGVLNTSHAWVGRPGVESWAGIRASRPNIRPDVPDDTAEERQAKAERIRVAAQTMRSKMQELDPDVLVIFGDDQSENYPAPELRVVPPINVFVGDEFSGRQADDRSAPHVSVKNSPDLAKAILMGLMERGFDPAYSLSLPNPDAGIGHAIMNPIAFYTDYDVPTIPIVLNAIFSPTLTARRGNQLGNAVRSIIDQYPVDLKVVVVGSGGLWHTQYSPDTWLNERFDRAGMELLTAGDARGWAALFDDYERGDDRSQVITEVSGWSSGMPPSPGPQFATREEIDWIAAASTVEGSPFKIVDFVSVYASPIDVAFAYCDDIRPLRVAAAVAG